MLASGAVAQLGADRQLLLGAMGLLSRSAETGVISESPRIVVVDDLATPEECAHIIGLAEGNLSPAEVLGADGERTGSTLRRTADIAWIYTDQTPVVRALVKRVAELAGLPARTCERIQVVHYDAGGKHTQHIDAYQPGVDDANLRRDGQRLKTGLLYLAAPTRGGATSFPKAKAKVKAKPGRLVLFDLVVPGTTEPDYNAMHAGNPVWSGEKWACNFWFCERTVKGASMKGRKPTATARRKRR